MKNSFIRLLPFFLLINACKKSDSPNPPIPFSINGNYESSGSLAVGDITMYTDTTYSGPARTMSDIKAIKDARIIRDYLSRRNINFFSFDVASEPYTSNLIINLDNNTQKAIITNSNTGSITNAGIESDRFYHSPNNDSLLNIVPSDTLNRAGIPVDSCYQYNAQISTTANQAAGVGLYKYIYRKRFPVQYKSGHLILHFVNSVMSKNNALTNCSSLINNEWGYDMIKYSWGTMNFLVPGDTIVIQTKMLTLNKK